MKFKFFLLLFIFMTAITFGSPKEKPIRLELNFGVPSLVGGSAEYVIPNFQDGKVAVDGDFSYIPLSPDETTDINISYMGIGGKYYITKPGEGLYAGGGLSRLNLGMEFDDPDLGTASADIGTIFIIGKLGYRYFLGPLTMNTEIGYGIGSLDDSVEVKYTDTDGSTTTETEDTSDVPVGSGQVFKVSIGFAF